MDTLARIAEIVLPVFLLVGAGYGLRRIGFVTEEANRAFTRMVFYVCAPALLFRSTARTPLYEAVDLRLLGFVAGATVLVTCCVYRVCRRCRPARRGVLAQGAHRSNMVFVGLPVVLNACGEGVLGPAAVFIAFMVVVYNLLSVTVLVLPHRGEEERNGPWARTATEILKNPLILACTAGLAASGAGLSLPVFLDRSLELTGRIAMPLALITVGAGLDFRRLNTELGGAAAVAGVKLLLYPAFVWAGLYALGYRDTALAFPVLITAAPTAVALRKISRRALTVAVTSA